MGWLEFIFAFAAFFLTHSVPIRPPIKPWLVARLGRAGFGIAYSALSLGVLAWLIGAAGRAPFVPLWSWTPWHAYLALATMLVVCLLLGLSIARPNPFSFGGARNDRFDPARPGIIRLTRHPLLLALALWAGVHMLANGDLAHVLLFGTFAGFAVLGMRVIDRRKQREMSGTWHRLDAGRMQGAWLPGREDIAQVALRLVLGAGLYVALLLSHPWLFGVNPIP
ncbi:NnrU family protein [Marivita sp. XM-24bin2]|jgi:uncharacterized membrane protein|uniref:NnrU family protein n=1 Tax=unclassified Marivita TaxID=2632480 RepID=UPI000D7A710A|nr:NnrU family protein [Marivita sp. XM-24bin2]MCR9109331.1 NnrU family protein [Paracoccaceae bacterium]PWL35658.1 MAG: NnrU family protein [Marivita sp. XM-24bin2]